MWLPLLSYCFKQLAESQISRFLSEARVWLFFLHIIWIYIDCYRKNININTALFFFSILWIYNFIHSSRMTWCLSKHESHLITPRCKMRLSSTRENNRYTQSDMQEKKLNHILIFMRRNRNASNGSSFIYNLSESKFHDFIYFINNTKVISKT